MNKSVAILALSGLIGTTLLAGCATSDSAMVYSQDQMRRAQTVQLGTIVSVQNVKMEGKQNEFLTLGGAALGGLAGSNIGQGKGSAAGAIVGALAGGIGAQAAQRGLGTKNALEITVKLDQGGRMVSIVQDADIPLTVGQRVRFMSGAGADRVVPY